MDKEELEIIEEEQEPWYRGPIKYIIAVFLLLIILTWSYSIYGGALNPEPKRIPSKGEVMPTYVLENKTTIITNTNDYYKLVNPSDPLIKQAADRIAAISCDGNKICQAKAMYYFVRDNYEYVADPVSSEYVMDPKEFLTIGVGDCEDGAIALYNLVEAIGVQTDFVFVPNHALIRIMLPDASSMYKIDGYIYLDWTCKDCGFGELSLNVRKSIK